MAFTIYTSGALILVLDSLENAPITFARDRFFTQEVTSDREEILFDVIDKKRRLAPYVSPLVRGKLMESRGYSTRMFKPAYLKPKGVVKPTDTLKRTAGEPIGGNLSLGERRDIHVKTHLQEHEEAITMREEVQCMEALRLGQVTVTGEGYGTQVVQYGRHADLRGVLSGVNLWSDASARPLKFIQDKARVIRGHSGGAIVSDVVMGVDAFAAMLDRLTETQLKVLFDSASRASEKSRVELGPRTAEKVRYEGTIGQFNFWTYSDTYQDEEGAEQQVMPADEIILTGPQVEGYRCYGAILDAKAGLQPLRRFPKMWHEEDPSAEFIMTQSAPLMVPLRPNASGSWRVL